MAGSEGYQVAKISRTGEVLQVAPLPTQSSSEMVLVHDCGMSENYLVFLQPPYAASGAKMLGALTGIASFGHSYQWLGSAERGTWLTILRKSDLSVVHAHLMDDVAHTGPLSFYHYANAYEDAGLLHVLVCRQIGSREELEARFSDMYATVWQGRDFNHIYNYAIDIASGTLKSFEPIVPVASPSPSAAARFEGQLPMEFPVVAPSVAGRRARYIYTTAFSGAGGGFWDVVQKLDLVTGRVQTRRCKVGRFSTEMEFVPRDDSGGDEDDGWLLFLEYDAAAHRSVLVVLDAADFDAASPVAEVRLPFHFPYAFHGTFVPGAEGPT